MAGAARGLPVKVVGFHYHEAFLLACGEAGTQNPCPSSKEKSSAFTAIGSSTDTLCTRAPEQKRADAG